MTAGRNALFQSLLPLRRPALEKLIWAYRQEFIDSYFEHLAEDQDEANECLRQFESAVLIGADNA